MRAAALTALMYADSRLLWRDPLLGWVLLLPVGLALLLRVLVPKASEVLLAAGGFDLAPYYALIMGGYLMTAPGIVGMVIGFLLLDERDARTLTALRVTPLSIRRYLGYRIALPLLVGTVSTLVGYPVIGITPLPLTPLLAIALVAGLSAPLLALVLATAAPNKVAGFAVVKVLNGVNLLPIAAFFLPVPLQYAAGVLPTYWPMRAFWSAAAGEEYVVYLGIGAIVGAFALVLAAWLFDRRLLRRG
jgi:fluoroquinolone transport system permease protein